LHSGYRDGFALYYVTDDMIRAYGGDVFEDYWVCLLPGKGNSKLQWREAGPLNHLDNIVDSEVPL